MSKIIVASAAGRARTITNFSGSTWGELKQHPEVAPLVTGSLDVIVNPGDITLNSDASALPEGDFNVYLIPTKNKAGLTPSEASQLGAEIGKAIAEASKKAGSDEITELKGALLDTIQDFYDVDLTEEQAKDSAEATAIAEAQKYVARRS